MTAATWIDPEEYAYTPRGAQVRNGRALFDDGKIRAIRCGIPDTFFSIPGHARVAGKYVRGYVYSDDGVYRFHIYAKE